MANTTVQTLVDAAYAASTANDPGKLATDGEMIGVLNRIYQTLWAVKAMSNPAKHEVKADVVLVASAGSIAQDLIDLRRVEGKTGTVSAGVRIPLIPVEEKDRTWHLAPRMYRLGNTIVSVGLTGDPGATDTVTVYYLDAPAALTALANQLDDRYDLRHQELLVKQLAVYLSSKDEGRDASEFSKLVEERNMLMELFMKQTGASTTALTSPLGGEIKQRLDSLFTTPSK